MSLLFSAALPAETLVRTAYYLEPGLCEKMMDGSYTGATIEYLSLLVSMGSRLNRLNGVSMGSDPIDGKC